MVRLNTFDAGVLAQIASRKRATQERRRHMLVGVSHDAERIGNVLITGNRAGATQDQLAAADRIVQWANRSK